MLLFVSSPLSPAGEPVICSFSQCDRSSVRQCHRDGDSCRCLYMQMEDPFFPGRLFDYLLVADLLCAEMPIDIYKSMPGDNRALGPAEFARLRCNHNMGIPRLGRAYSERFCGKFIKRSGAPPMAIAALRHRILHPGCEVPGNLLAPHPPEWKGFAVNACLRKRTEVEVTVCTGGTR